MHAAWMQWDVHARPILQEVLVSAARQVHAHVDAAMPVLRFQAQRQCPMAHASQAAAGGVAATVCYNPNMQQHCSR